MFPKLKIIAKWLEYLFVAAGLTILVTLCFKLVDSSEAAVPHIYNMPAYDYAIAVTPNDTNTLAGTPLAIYVGVAGDVTVDFDNASGILLKNAPAGLLLGISPLRVKSTGTTATNIVALY